MKFQKGDIIGHKDLPEFQNYIVVGTNKDDNYLIKEINTNKWVDDREEIEENYIKIGEITKESIVE
jgi:hypothetical protein